MQWEVCRFRPQLDECRGGAVEAVLPRIDLGSETVSLRRDQQSRRQGEDAERTL